MKVNLYSETDSKIWRINSEGLSWLQAAPLLCIEYDAIM